MKKLLKAVEDYKAKIRSMKEKAAAAAEVG